MLSVICPIITCLNEPAADTKSSIATTPIMIRPGGEQGAPAIAHQVTRRQAQHGDHGRLLPDASRPSSSTSMRSAAAMIFASWVENTKVVPKSSRICRIRSITLRALS